MNRLARSREVRPASARRKSAFHLGGSNVDWRYSPIANPGVVVSARGEQRKRTE